MASETSPAAPSATPTFTASDIESVLTERGWLAGHAKIETDPALEAWSTRAADLLGPQAADRAALADLLKLVFSYNAPAILQKPSSQAVLAREGSRDVIRELANRVLDGGEIDSDRFKEIIDSMKAALPQRSRELFHPIRLALAGRAGEGELDRVILLLDSAARLDFAVPVKGARQRMLEFCAAMD
jgi:hypothetical protein